MKECFLIGAYCHTEERLNELKRCLFNLKRHNLPILISSHYTLPADIIQSVDGFVYDPDNEILYQKDFEKYQTGFWYFYEDNNIRIDKAFDFHHDYAFWTQLRNGFALAKNKGFDMCYFLDFDVELDDETFNEIRTGSIGYDSCFYPLSDFMYLVTFACNPEIGLKVTETKPTFYDYFYNKPGQTNCEKVFYKELLKLNAKLNLIPKQLTDKPNFQNFTSALNYTNNNYFIEKDKKIVAGIVPCCTEDNDLYLFFNLKENNNFIIYVEYNGRFFQIDKLLNFLGKITDNSVINIYGNGKLFYTKQIDDSEQFKKMNIIKIK